MLTHYEYYGYKRRPTFATILAINLKENTYIDYGNIQPVLIEPHKKDKRNKKNKVIEVEKPPWNTKKIAFNINQFTRNPGTYKDIDGNYVFFENGIWVKNINFGDVAMNCENLDELISLNYFLALAVLSVPELFTPIIYLFMVLNKDIILKERKITLHEIKEDDLILNMFYETWGYGDRVKELDPWFKENWIKLAHIRSLILQFLIEKAQEYIQRIESNQQDDLIAKETRKALDNEDIMYLKDQLKLLQQTASSKADLSNKFLYNEVFTRTDFKFPPMKKKEGKVASVLRSMVNYRSRVFEIFVPLGFVYVNTIVGADSDYLGLAISQFTRWRSINKLPIPLIYINHYVLKHKTYTIIPRIAF